MDSFAHPVLSARRREVRMDYRTDWPVVAVTALLALATFLLVLATFLLVRGSDQFSEKELEPMFTSTLVRRFISTAKEHFRPIVLSVIAD
jgi:hypothetical protein